jgi:antibiotic biosynthesis monooxygenase (ABM) superfamily enzyme
MTTSSEHAVTVLISRQVKQGCAADFERVMEKIIGVSATFKGHLGAQLVRPGDEQGVYDSLYHIVLAFDSASSLKDWQDSPARSLGLAAAAPFIEGQTLVRQVRA